jgi:hypothetical protein
MKPNAHTDEDLAARLQAVPSAPPPPALEGDLLAGIPEQLPLPPLAAVLRPAVVVQTLATAAAAVIIVLLVTAPDVETGARRLAAACREARALALDQRQHVALLLPCDEARYRSSAYRLCVVDARGRFKRFAPGSEWRFLPDSLLVSCVPNTSLCTGVPLPAGRDMKACSVRGIVFRPNGTLTRQDMGAIAVINRNTKDRSGNLARAAFSVGWVNGRIAFE